MVCRRVSLARGELASVEQCQCGQLHVHVGPFSLRFHPLAVASIHATLGEALEMLRLSRAAAPEPRPNAGGGEA